MKSGYASLNPSLGLQTTRFAHPRSLVMPANTSDRSKPIESLDAEHVRKHIEQLSSDLWASVVDRDYATIERKLAPHCKFSFDNQPEVDFVERLERHKQLQTEYPEYCVQASGTPLVDLQDLKAGSARAFVNYEVHGAPPGMVIPGTMYFDFRRMKGQWMLVRSSGIRIGAS